MAASDQKAKNETKTAETQYQSAELINAAEAVFDVKPEVMAGALYGVKKASKTEAKELLRAFLKNKVEGAKE